MLQDLSSFITQPYRRKYLAAYCKRMSHDVLSALIDDNVASVLLEQGFPLEYNPRSIYKVDKLYDSLAKYAPRHAPRVDVKDHDIQQGINLAYTCFAKPKGEPALKLRRFTPEFIYSITSNLKGSAGLTAWGQTKAESYVRAYERGKQQIMGQKRWEPCVAFKRTQFNDKTRLVWGYPYAATAIEGLFARPLIERFKKGGNPMAFGKPTGVLGAELRVSSYHNEFAYSTDVSSFDSSISSELISVAFSILSTWFDFTAIEPETGVSYHEIWKQIVWYFIHTPIFMPDGNIYKGKRHGVPSGSYFTQMIDSIVNVILIGAISYAFNLNVNKEDIFVLGDDILFWSNRKVSLKHITRYASAKFGMKFNASKSALFSYNETIHYLGRDWTKGIPWLREDEIIARMVNPENFRVYAKDPDECERQVRMLFASYAAVYYNAYPIYLKCMGVGARYSQSNMSIENYVYGGNYDVTINPDFLSGLQRFQLKYGDNHGGGYVPLALQFWK